MKRKNNILVGLFFILAAIAVVINQLGYLANINLWTIFITLIMLPIIYKGITKINFGGILIPLAIIGILYDKQLGITALTPWPILIVAVLLSIGLTIIFGEKRKNYNHNNEKYSRVIDSKDEEVINLMVKFSSSIKYVNSDNFKEVNLYCEFGAMKVYFDNAVPNKESAVININMSFSGAELYIPKEWEIVNNTNVILSGVDEKNSPLSKTGPIVYLNGDIKLSGIEIIYI